MWAAGVSIANPSSHLKRSPAYPNSVLQPIPEAGDPIRAWGDVPYLFSHIALEYQSHSIYTCMTSQEKYVRHDTQLFKWLYGSLSKAVNDRMFANFMSSADSQSPGRNRLPSPGAIEETWVWRTVIGAYALVFGKIPTRDPENYAEQSSQDDDWLTVWIFERRASGIPMHLWPWNEVLDRISWLGTDAGIVYLEKLWKDAANGM